MLVETKLCGFSSVTLFGQTNKVTVTKHIQCQFKLSDIFRIAQIFLPVHLQ